MSKINEYYKINELCDILKPMLDGIVNRQKNEEKKHKVNSENKKNGIIQWKGFTNIRHLYLMYLLNKYKSKCLFKTMTLEFRIEEETIKEGFFKKGLKFFKPLKI